MCSSDLEADSAEEASAAVLAAVLAASVEAWPEEAEPADAGNRQILFEYSYLKSVTT